MGELEKTVAVMILVVGGAVVAVVVVMEVEIGGGSNIRC